MFLQPEEHADVAIVRFRGPLVQGVGLFGQNVSRNMEISFGTAIGVAPGQKPCTRFGGEVCVSESDQSVAQDALRADHFVLTHPRVAAV